MRTRSCLSGRTPGGGRPFNLVSEESGLALVGQLLREASLLRLRLRGQRRRGRGPGGQGGFDGSGRNKGPTHRTLRPKQTGGQREDGGPRRRRRSQRTGARCAVRPAQLGGSATVPSRLRGTGAQNHHPCGAANPGGRGCCAFKLRGANVAADARLGFAWCACHQREHWLNALPSPRPAHVIVRTESLRQRQRHPARPQAAACVESEPA